jgi:hypothetical protein
MRNSGEFRDTKTIGSTHIRLTERVLLGGRR